jgi:hypothetical protein
MTTPTFTTYSSKSTAIRGAKRAGLDIETLDFFTVEGDRWAFKVKAPVKPAKLPTYKQIATYKKSTIEKPVDFVHSYLDANPEMTRKQAVSALVAQGVNYSTARTQYQRWFSKR